MKILRSKTYLFILFIFFITSSFSLPKQDSLRYALDNAKEDTSRVKLMIELGDFYAGQESYPSANEYYQKAILLTSEIKNYKLKAVSLDKKGRLLRKQGKFNESLKYHFEAMDIALEINYKEALPAIYNNIGVTYRRKTEDNNALKYHLKALQAAEEVNDFKVLAYAYNSLGIIYSYQGNYDDALEYYNKALELARKRNNSVGIAINLNSIAWIFELKKEFNKAIEYYRKSLEVNQKVGNKEGIAICYNDLGKIYRTIGEYKISLEYYKKTLEINEKDGDKRYIAISRINLGQVYADLGNYTKSINELNKGLEYALQLNTKRLIMEAYKQLSVTYEKLNKYKASLKYNQLSAIYRDSIYNEENSKQIAEFKTLYETERKDKENELQKAELEQKIKRKNIQRNFFFLSSVLLLVILIVTIRNYIQKRKTNSLLEIQKNEIRAQAKKLDKANQKIVKNTKLKELFFANTSHEIRTPVNLIVGFTKLLLATELSSKQKSYIQNIQKSGKNLIAIVNDILDFSKIEAGRLKIDNIEFNIINAIKSVYESLEIKAKDKNLELSLELTNNLPTHVKGDQVRLNQILSNLVANAIKFTDHGEVKISIEKTSENDKNITFLFKVSDTGIGIASDRLENIFESYSQAFDQTSRMFGGTGLGLSIVRNLVIMQKGEIKVESEVNKGSTFTFSIPYEIPETHSIKVQKEQQTIEKVQKIKDMHILLVDDNPINRALATDTIHLFNKKIKIDEAENGEKAIKKIQENSYNLVLMDLLMPVLDGYEATKIIRTELKSPYNDIPILGMTAVSEEDEKEKCLEIGMNEYITKPFEPEDLFLKILSLTE